MHAANILNLGLKELRGLARDPGMLALIVFAFTISIYTASTAMPEQLNKTPIAIVDEDRSPLSTRIVDAFFPPFFLPPTLIEQPDVDRRMDAGLDIFALDVPPDFQRDLLAGRRPTIQLNVDATRMNQAFVGSGYVQSIVAGEIESFLRHYRAYTPAPVELALRSRFNPTLTISWFSAVIEVVNNITMLSIILTGAALIREREHGTIEHLLVMPVTPLEIMAGKIWSMALVVLAACTLSLLFVVKGLLAVPIEGSVALFLAGAAVHLFATTSMGIFLATVARSMPQFGLLLILVLIPLEMLSGGTTPRESMPLVIQYLMLAAPTTHFIMLAQAILFRGAGFETVWPHFVAIAVIGALLFGLALARFRKSVGETA
ncbi:MAG: ABC transporter permease [Reyranella sp.]|uniref:ABC transporter permease n=1 Tax=Reyranella sp. TaxID=1929291 RepID=UPI0012231C81|nr:ABC transporter permease [Reyranella sp.]TAJ39964.1 MAG: ABC transporter permease [Reyranella sp.]